MTTAVTRSSSLFLERGRPRVLVTAARLLTQAATRLLPPAAWGPSPCCTHEFLIPYPQVPGALVCSRDGRLYTPGGTS